MCSKLKQAFDEADHVTGGTFGENVTGFTIYIQM
jgi:hypothetical protein